MRVLLRLLSPLFGLAVAVAGALLAVEAGWTLARPDSAPLLVSWPGWRDGLAAYSWSDTPVLVAGGVLALVGLLLFLVTGRARRHDVRMTDPADDVTVVTSPRSLARLVGQRVRDEDGVNRASVTATARKVRVRVTSRLNSEAELRPALTSRVTDLVSGLPLARTPRVRVVVNSPKDHR
ncbi:MAG: DUF6286 domain-containing protein [Pseudonocardiaceae bacterium]